MNRKEIINLFKLSFRNWENDNVFVRAAALTFFIILPLPSLLLLVLAFLELFVSPTRATQQLVQLITVLTGPEVAGLFKQLLVGASSPFSSIWSSISIIGFSLAGAIGAFGVLRDTMNVIWEVKPLKPTKLAVRIRKAIGPFILVSSLGLIVIVWEGISTTLFNAIRLLSVNKTLTADSLSAIQVFFAFGLSALLFAIIYKVLPDRRIHWMDVVLAAVVTAVAFTVTNYVLGAYVQTFTVTTFVGAAGALFVILLWIYILNHIVLFGAEVSKAYAQTYGPHPKEHMTPKMEKMLKPLEKAEEKLERLEEEAKGD